MEENVTVAHLDLVTKLLTNVIDEGFSSVHERIGRFENEVRPQLLSQAADIAVLKYKSQQAVQEARAASEHVQASKVTTRKSATAWGTGAAAFVWGAIELIKAVKTLVAGH